MQGQKSSFHGLKQNQHLLKSFPLKCNHPDSVSVNYTELEKIE
jgi:hypothetical protein